MSQSTTPAPASEIKLNAEEEAAVKRAQDSALAIVATIGTGPNSLSPMAARKGDEPIGFITVPKPFYLNLTHVEKVDFPVGTYPAPLRFADHWWAQGNGVKVLSQQEILSTVSMDQLPPADRLTLMRNRAAQAAATARAMQDEADAAELALMEAQDKISTSKSAKTELDPTRTPPKITT